MKKNRSKIIRNKLLVRKILPNILLVLFNWFLRSRKSDSAVALKKNSKILICNNAHLGDIVLSTAILPEIKKQYPGCSIFLLTGSWSEKIIKDNILVNGTIIYDHWKLNRNPVSILKKIKRHVFTFSTALKQLKKAKFDVAIDLNFNFPNAIVLCFRAHIPVRIAFTSGGFGNLLTHPLEWKEKPQHVIDYYLELLHLADPGFAVNSHGLKPFLVNKVNPAHEKLPDYETLGIKKNNYLIFHMGSGLARKEWNLENWIELKEVFKRNGKKIVFTGQGEREQILIEQVMQPDSENCVNLCNKLSLTGFIDLVKHAGYLFCVDSLAGHIASAFDIPTVIIGNGINATALWRPNAITSDYIVKKLPCLPCYTGCAEMNCIKDITTLDILAAIKIIVD